MKTRPNIIVIMCDQLKATALHLYGSPFCRTPNLERLAGEGVLYEHAFTPQPLCGPARVSMWTAQYPHTHGGRRNQTLMPGNAVHAFKTWKELGYVNALIGKNHCFETNDDLALFDVWCEAGHKGPSRAAPRGMAWVADSGRTADIYAETMAAMNQSPRFSYAITDHPETCYSTGLLTAQTEAFLEQFKDRPFALWLSFPDPHEPYIAPRNYVDMIPEDIELPPGRDDEFAGPEVPERLRVLYEMLGMDEDSGEDIRNLLRVYHANLMFIDDGVGRVLDALDRLGLKEKTIVVFCSDHGDFAGEHNMSCKGGAFYDCLTRVPLIFSGPGIPVGQTEDSMASLIDIVPTLYHLSGIDIPRCMEGKSLPLITEEAPRSAVFSEYGCGGPAFRMTDLLCYEKPYGRKALCGSLNWREAEGRPKMVRTKRWKYVHDTMDEHDELYDLEQDPAERWNVAGEPRNRDVVNDMKTLLMDWSINTEDAKPVPLPNEKNM